MILKRIGSIGMRLRGDCLPFFVKLPPRGEDCGSFPSARKIEVGFLAILLVYWFPALDQQSVEGQMFGLCVLFRSLRKDFVVIEIIREFVSKHRFPQVRPG